VHAVMTLSAINHAPTTGHALNGGVIKARLKHIDYTKEYMTVINGGKSRHDGYSGHLFEMASINMGSLTCTAFTSHSTIVNQSFCPPVAHTFLTSISKVKCNNTNIHSIELHQSLTFQEVWGGA